jgi:hypothetical protein
MEKMLTAEEFLEKENLPETLSGGTLVFAMKEFAKLHVEAALKEANEKAEIVILEKSVFLDSSSILNSYPRENIK